MKESELQSAIMDAMQVYHWRYAHFRPAIRQSGGWSTAMSGHVGYPDLTAVKDGDLLFMELKSEKGLTTTQQNSWLNELSCVSNVEVYVIRPADLDNVIARLAGDRDALRHRRM